MKRVFMIMVCLLSLVSASTGLKAQEVTIRLMLGWNLISYPYPETVDLGTAFENFEPLPGDVIESSYGYSEYTTELEWFGEVTSLRPGWGYLYYSKRTEVVTIVFSHSSMPAGSVTVTTSEPMLITAVSALSGGEVVSNDGTYILVKGLCWAAHEYPTTNDDFYEEAGSGVGTFSISMAGLNIGTTYYVRAYAVTPSGTVYGNQKSFTTRDGIPEVTTDTVYNILGDKATCDGSVTDNGGLNVTARGVCWSTSHNPTVSDSHTTDGSGLGSFNSRITGMELGTTYYVRAYATTSAGTGYGEELSFTTQTSSVGLYVDLGLPSGTLWATCNVGAEYPEAYGHYVAWGVTLPTEFYGNGYYFQHSYNGDVNALTKYCNDPGYGYNGFIDNLTTLLPEDDAASVNWGAEWRMPTKQEWQELIDNTTCIWTTQNGVNGRLFSASNGNSIFLPAAGQIQDYPCVSDYVTICYWDFEHSDGYYWSSSLDTNRLDCAWAFTFGSGDYGVCNSFRPYGQSVRAVRCKNSIINVTANSSEGTVSGGGTYLDHSSCTVTATANEGYVFAYWAENGVLVSTDATYTFAVNGNRTLVAYFYGVVNGHGYVDLGLPSGLLWATCDVGAEEPWANGGNFAWGETQPKDTYDWNTYQYCNGSYNTLTKYCTDSDYGYNGFTDDLTTLLPEDDAATANWGPDWRMPTKEEWQELWNNTPNYYVSLNGVKNGCLFTASNGNILILPVPGDYGCYWSSTLDTIYPEGAWFCNLPFFLGGYDILQGERYFGSSVRAVRSSLQN